MPKSSLILALGIGYAALAATPSFRSADDGFGELVLVPAGAFKMGDNFGDGEPRERPVHLVDLDAYYIGKHEVTNAQWRKFRDDPGYDDPKFVARRQSCSQRSGFLLDAGQQPWRRHA